MNKSKPMLPTTRTILLRGPLNKCILELYDKGSYLSLNLRIFFLTEWWIIIRNSTTFTAHITLKYTDLQFNSKFLLDFSFNQIHPLLFQFVVLIVKFLFDNGQVFRNGIFNNTINPLKQMGTFGEHCRKGIIWRLEFFRYVDVIEDCVG